MSGERTWSWQSTHRGHWPNVRATAEKDWGGVVRHADECVPAELIALFVGPTHEVMKGHRSTRLRMREATRYRPQSPGHQVGKAQQQPNSACESKDNGNLRVVREANLACLAAHSYGGDMSRRAATALALQIQEHTGRDVTVRGLVRVGPGDWAIVLERFPSHRFTVGSPAEWEHMAAEHGYEVGATP